MATSKRTFKSAFAASLVAVLALTLFAGAALANNGNGNGNGQGNGGPSPERGNSLSAVATPVDIAPEDITFHEINGTPYVAIQHNVATDFDGYSTLVQREPARTGGKNVVTENPAEFDTAWLGILGSDGEGVEHKGKLSWYYEVGDGEWVSLVMQFNGKGELKSVNGVAPAN